jgi:hypothetical protein
MGEHLRRWWRYPFAVAGPVPVLFTTAIAASGVLSVLLLDGYWQLVPGVVVVDVGTLAVRRARSRFMLRRGMTVQKSRRARNQVASEAILGAAAVVAVLALGWELGWLWPLFAGAVLGRDLYYRRRWAKLGYPGDPRWARDWSPEA